MHGIPRGDRTTVDVMLFAVLAVVLAVLGIWLVRIPALPGTAVSGPRVEIISPRDQAVVTGQRVGLRARIDAAVDVPVTCLLDGYPILPGVWAEPPSP